MWSRVFCLGKQHDVRGVQHRFGGMRDVGWGLKNRGGIRDTRTIEGGIRDENSLAGSGCSHFKWWDVGTGIALELTVVRDLNSE